MSHAREFRAGRIHRGAEIRRILAQGRRYPSQHVVAVVQGREEGGPRLGVIVGRRLGGAVARNRAKRRLREIARSLWPRLVGPVDVLLLARPSADRASFGEIRASVEHSLRRAGRLAPEQDLEPAAWERG
ncbi:MAG: ribonuclease P protein component [Armatimonadota bacterium]